VYTLGGRGSTGYGIWHLLGLYEFFAFDRGSLLYSVLDPHQPVLSQRAPELVKHRPTAPCLSIRLVLYPAGCGRPLAFQSSSQALKLLGPSLRWRADAQQPPRDAPSGQCPWQQLDPPCIPNDPSHQCAKQRARPLEERQLNGEHVLVRLIREGKALELICWLRCRRRRRRQSVLVHVRHHGVVLREDSKDDGRRSCREIIEVTKSQWPQAQSQDGWRQD
jgi:hypothetical protein